MLKTVGFFNEVRWTVGCRFTKLIPLSEPLRIGLILLGTAAGAPFLPKIVETAKKEVAFAVALTVLLLVCTLGYLPLVLPLFGSRRQTNTNGFSISRS